MTLTVSGVDRPRAWLWIILAGLVALVLLLVLAAMVVPIVAITVYSALRHPVVPAAISDERRAVRREPTVPAVLGLRWR